MPYNRTVDNKNGEVNKARVAKGIIVAPAATGKKPTVFISSIEPFNSKLWNKNENRAWRMDLDDSGYILGTYFNSSVVQTIFYTNIY